jgi:ankyrin repeat protein
MECPLVAASLSEQISILDLFLELDDDDFDHFWNNSNYSKQDAILHSLVAACAAGCVSSVAHLLSKCPPYTLPSTFKGITPLIAAIQQGQYKVVKLLLLNKNVNINVNARDETGTPPLIHAVQGAYYNILDMLLHQNVGGGGGVDVNATDIRGQTALIHAVARGDIISAESLINVGRCDMNKRDKDGLSALSWACLSGNAKMTLYLVQYSGPAAVAMGDSDRMGRGPLHIAVSSRQQDVVQVGKNSSRVNKYIQKIQLD